MTVGQDGAASPFNQLKKKKPDTVGHCAGESQSVVLDTEKSLRNARKAGQDCVDALLRLAAKVARKLPENRSRWGIVRRLTPRNARAGNYKNMPREARAASPFLKSALVADFWDAARKIKKFSKFQKNFKAKRGQIWENTTI